MTTIENARYQGYLWYSDQRQPEVYLGKTSVAELILDESKNPFIVEGNLYDAERQLSISIKFVDGKYIVTRYDLNTTSADESVSEEHFLTNSRIRQSAGTDKADECGTSVYKRIWKAIPDALNGGRKVLKPHGLAFAGFRKNENE